MRSSRFWALQARDLGERLAERDRVGVARRVLRREALELAEQDCALPLGHAHVRADARVVVEPAAALAAAVGVVPRGLQQRRVVADQGAALARRHQLALLHREAAERAVAADAAAAPLRAVRVRAVLDQVQAAALAQRHEQIEVADRPGDVHADDRARPRRDCGLGGGDVDAQRLGVDVDDHGRGVDRQHGARARDERHARHDHLVALADAAGDERRLEGMRPVRERQAPRRALEARELAREAECAVAVPRPPAAGVERREQLLALALAPLGPRRIRVGLGDGRAAEQCGQIHAVATVICAGLSARAVR